MSETSTAQSISSDGKLLAAATIATATAPVTIEVWNLKSSELIQRALVRGKFVHDLAFQPNTGLLAVATDEAVELWDLKLQRTRKEFQGRKIQKIAFSRDGHTLAGAGGTADDPMLVLWDAAPEAVVTTGGRRTLTGTGPTALSADGTRYAAVEHGQLVYRELADGRELQRIEAELIPADELILSPDGRWAATVAGSKTNQSHLKILNLETGIVQHTREGAGQTLVHMVFLKDSRAVLLRDNHDLIRWDVQTGQADVLIPGGGDGTISFAVSDDGDRLALSGWYSNERKSMFKLGHLSQPRELQNLSLDDHYVVRVAFSADGTKLAAVSRSMTTIWDVQTGRETQRLPCSASWSTSLAFSPTGNELITCNNDLTIWSVASGKKVQSIVNESQMGKYDRAYLTPDGNQILMSGPGQPVLLFDRSIIEAPPAHSDKS